MLCFTLLSCSTAQSQYIEIKEPENTKKIIDTRYYEAKVINGEYVPGNELLSYPYRPTIIFYGEDDKILLRVETSGCIEEEQRYYYNTVITYYYYDSCNHQLKSIKEIVTRRNKPELSDVVELLYTVGDLAFKRNELGLVTDITGFGSAMGPDDDYLEANTKFEYNKNGKIIKKIYDRHSYHYKYFSLENGYTVEQCSIKYYYGNDDEYSLETRIYDGSKKVKTLCKHYIAGKLTRDSDTTFIYDDANRLIKTIVNSASANVFTKEELSDTNLKLYADDSIIENYKYDENGKIVSITTIGQSPKLDINHFVDINGTKYLYEDRITGNLKKTHGPQLIAENKYYYNMNGDCCQINVSSYLSIVNTYLKEPAESIICVRTIEYR